MGKCSEGKHFATNLHGETHIWEILYVTRSKSVRSVDIKGNFLHKWTRWMNVLLERSNAVIWIHVQTVIPYSEIHTTGTRSHKSMSIWRWYSPGEEKSSEGLYFTKTSHMKVHRQSSIYRWIFWIKLHKWKTSRNLLLFSSCCLYRVLWYRPHRVGACSPVGEGTEWTKT